MTTSSASPSPVPEKARVLDTLKRGGFNVPDFIYVPAADLRAGNFDALQEFLATHRGSFKIIARSAHPQEEFYKGGTFDSLETYADVGGVVYAWKRMIKFAGTAKRLSIQRQQKFNRAPQIDPHELGVIVMPLINVYNAKAKTISGNRKYD